MTASRLLFAFGLLFALTSAQVCAKPLLSHGTAVDGAIAYQDDLDPTQFWYLPTTTNEILGQQLQTFNVTYYGIGPPHYIQTGNGNFVQGTGGIISGSFAVNITDDTRKTLVAAIASQFNVPNPKLAPIIIRDPSVDSVLLTKIFGNYGTVAQNIPSGFQIGPPVVFSAGSNSSLFAEVVAESNADPGIVPNPAFGMNISAKAEFQGDPWFYHISCNLSQFWRDVRTHVGASAHFGWFSLGHSDYDSIIQTVSHDGTCTFVQHEGSLDLATYGRQIGEMMKQIFTDINNKAISGQDYFRFMPNPEAPAAGGGGGLDLFPWGVQVNASMSEAQIDQHITFNEDVDYSGPVLVPIAFAAVIAVQCNNDTQQFFVDLGNQDVPCMTQDKINTFQARAKAQSDAVIQHENDLWNQFLQTQGTAHPMTVQQWQAIKQEVEATDWTNAYVSVPAASVGAAKGNQANVLSLKSAEPLAAEVLVKRLPSSYLQVLIHRIRARNSFTLNKPGSVITKMP